MNHSKKYDFKTALDFAGALRSNSRPLAICLEKIAHQQQLLQCVRAALPPHIAEHTLHCIMSGARLLIYTNSATWASQIRFYQEDILNKLQPTAQLKITRMQVKVMQEIIKTESERQVQLPSYQTVQAMLGEFDGKSVDVLESAMTNLAKTLLKRISC